MATVGTRAARIAEQMLAEQQYVTSIDVLLGLGWLAQPNVERWQQGRTAYLSGVQVDDAKCMAAFAGVREWAMRRGLQSFQTDYGELRFTAAGDPETERAFRTRWAVAEQFGPVVADPKPRELVVISPLKPFVCDACHDTGDLLVKTNAGTLCLDCADLGHLGYLPSGDAALTRRAKKTSRLAPVVVRWSRSRKRYERQGILAEIEAIEQAAEQCREDAGARAARRAYDQERRGTVDEKFQEAFAAAILEQFPGCPRERSEAIAQHAALRGSGRVGRSAAGRALDPDAIHLAVAASVRHLDTDYDELLMSGVDRDDARHQVRDRVDDVLDAWRDGAVPLDG